MRLSMLRVVLALGLTAPTSAHAPFVLQPGKVDLDAGPDGNTEIFDTPKGLVVIDTGRHPEHSQAILDYARKAGRPVVAVVNTHWHLDHTTGNRDIFAAYPQASLVATNAMAGALEGFLARSRANAEQRLADPNLPAAQRVQTERTLAAMNDRRAMVPAQPVEQDGVIDIGGRRFGLHVAHAAATEADLWLTVPDERLAVVGDLVVAPVPFFDTACGEGWKRALDTIAAARWTTLIPGHGAPMSRADFDRWHAAFNAWLGCAESAAPAAQCANDWMRDAKGFYTTEEEKGARALAEGYVAEVIRAPADQRMAYCRKP